MREETNLKRIMNLRGQPRNARSNLIWSLEVAQNHIVVITLHSWEMVRSAKRVRSTTLAWHPLYKAKSTLPNIKLVEVPPLWNRSNHVRRIEEIYRRQPPRVTLPLIIGLWTSCLSRKQSALLSIPNKAPSIQISIAARKYYDPSFSWMWTLLLVSKNVLLFFQGIPHLVWRRILLWSIIWVGICMSSLKNF